MTVNERTPQAGRHAGVVIKTAQDLAAYDAFVTAHPESTGYHLSGWREVFESALSQRCHLLTATEGGRLTGILPVVEVRSRLFGHAISSLPFANYGGVLTSTSAAAAALLDAVRSSVRTGGFSYAILRHRRQQFPELPSRTHKVTMTLSLPESSETLWQQLDRKVRNQIRKAEKSELTVQDGGLELLNHFYDVFSENMRDLGTPVYGRRLFAEILRAFPDTARLTVVYRDRVPIAGGLTYAYQSTIEVPSASSLRSCRSICPNYLLYWHILRRAIADGYRVFDFGRSSVGDGPFQFKKQWGAIVEPLCWEYVTDRALPDIGRDSRKFSASIELWKRLPVGVASRLGPFITRGIA